MVYVRFRVSDRCKSLTPIQPLATGANKWQIGVILLYIRPAVGSFGRERRSDTCIHPPSQTFETCWVGRASKEKRPTLGRFSFDYLRAGRIRTVGDWFSWSQRRPWKIGVLTAGVKTIALCYTSQVGLANFISTTSLLYITIENLLIYKY